MGTPVSSRRRTILACRRRRRSHRLYPRARTQPLLPAEPPNPATAGKHSCHFLPPLTKKSTNEHPARESELREPEERQGALGASCAAANANPARRSRRRA